jgi:hypothetical protein
VQLLVIEGFGLVSADFDHVSADFDVVIADLIRNPGMPAWFGGQARNDGSDQAGTAIAQSLSRTNGGSLTATLQRRSSSQVNPGRRRPHQHGAVLREGAFFCF